MKCSLKVMVSIALTMAVVIAIGYWTLPQLRGAISTLAIVASAFVCPLAMVVMMRNMPAHVNRDDTATRTADETKP
ncbi:DUF2933 domain-containing protein [Burkholderia stagnalis]|uniref:DUF2933 domain-containing protein n=1 Tax=Burkholderia stagnalis TaxID=1503054 RepID=A0ABX9YRN9_9BURK|nr:DUF2933 domain-containing protein [Burkholderia stagnalis]RQZ19612.1 DUF2933 domain-containing protein [Burkholderia stagnalis]